MNILSIIWGTCSTAALMVDGKIVSCVSEEKFSRIKNDESYPFQSVLAVLKQGNIRPEELDLIVMGGARFDAKAVLCHKWSNFSIQDRLKEQHQYWYPKLYQNREINFLDVFKDKIDTYQYPGEWSHVIDFLSKNPENSHELYLQDFRRKTLVKQLGIEPQKIIFVNHHRAHGYYSYYGSPLKKDKGIILTADGYGDSENATVSLAEGGEIRLLSSSQNLLIGRLYRYITLLLGMKPDEHEYKVMGLAAYSKSKYNKEILEIFKKTMYVDGLQFSYKVKPPDLYFYFKERLEGYRFDAIAGAIQEYTQDILVKWVNNAIELTKANKLYFGGGVAMNIKAAMEIANAPKIKDMFICPSPSDESLAIGGAYVAMHDICITRKQDPVSYLKPLENAYLGPEVDLREVKDTVEYAYSQGNSVSRGIDLAYVAKLLSDGKIVGRCSSRCEFGARALGNRSILADPRNIQVIKIINEKIKNRDFWMPFSPAILATKAEDYIINPKSIKSPYMTIAFETTLKARQELIAGLHQGDLTARPQIVSRELNEGYHDLISEFHSLTGVAGLLNTSFNVHGEPMVLSSKDAMSVFERTDLDVLIIEDYLIEKKSGK